MGKSRRDFRNWHDEEDYDEEMAREFRRSQKKRFVEEGQRSDHEEQDTRR